MVGVDKMRPSAHPLTQRGCLSWVRGAGAHAPRETEAGRGPHPAVQGELEAGPQPIAPAVPAPCFPEVGMRAQDKCDTDVPCGAQLLAARCRRLSGSWLLAQEQLCLSSNPTGDTY